MYKFLTEVMTTVAQDWQGVVTGIRLIHIIAAATAERQAGFLVK